MVLRNFPPQQPFVVQWQFPLMVEQPDLDPTELKKSEADMPPSEDDEYLLGLLDEKPLTTTEWQRKATTIAKATFYRRLRNLKPGGRAAQDPTSGAWTRAATPVAGPHAVPSPPAFANGQPNTPTPTQHPGGESTQEALENGYSSLAEMPGTKETDETTHGQQSSD